MAYSFVDTPGDGVTTAFAVPFSYLDQADVKTSVDGVDVTHTWSNDSLISITPAPASDTIVRVYRNTDRSKRLVDFEDDSIFDEALLDQMNEQLFYIAQETLDYAEYNAGQTADQVTIIQGIVDAADAKATSATATAAGATATANTAKATADAAKVAADAATANAASATTTANTAKTTANTAKATADSTIAAAANAVATANAAKATAEGIDPKATQALSTANGIDAKATQALSTANGIDAKATQALSTANTAKSTADTAKSTADTAKSTADGIDAKASTALATANAAKTAADSAKATAEGIDAKATQAQADSSAALTASDTASTDAATALSTANGIDAKATQAKSDAATALSTANGIDAKATSAVTTANTAKAKADTALQLGSYGIGTATALAGGTDLNTLVQPGEYAYTSGTALVNAPATAACYVSVIGRASYPVQVFRSIYTAVTYIRAAKVFNPTAAAADWTAWDKTMLVGAFGVGAHQTATANTTWGAKIGDIVGNGFYATADDFPVDFPTNKGMHPVGWSVTRANNHGAQMAITRRSSDSPSTVQVRSYEGVNTWGAWRRLLEVGDAGLGSAAKAIQPADLDAPTLASGFYAVAITTPFRSLPVGYYAVTVNAFNLEGTSVQFATDLNTKRIYRRCYVTNGFEPVDDPDFNAWCETQIHGLLDASGFAYLYPNGGTQAAPANVSTNSRYVLSNPFPGHEVIVKAEVMINNQWGDSGWFYSSGGYGTKAAQLDLNTIVVQTGATRVAYTSHASGDPFGHTTNSYTTLPCRVKVWRCRA
jgi:hypothetical protein